MKKAGIILIVLLIPAVYGLGQGLAEVSGKILDTVSVPLSKATIRLVSTKDSLTVFSREDGTFSFHSVQALIFDLVVTMKGYMPFVHRYEIASGNRHRALPPIVLHEDYEQLETVTVSAPKTLTVKEDTVEYRAGAFKVHVGDELEGLLKLLPGMISDTGGNIIIDGKKIKKMQINGKDFVGSDLLTALHSIPVNIIDRVQVIDDYGDKARLTGVKTGSPEKVLNIITKQDKREGIVGKYEAGAGNLGKYVGSAFSNFFKGDRQLTLNARLVNNSPVGKQVEKLAAFVYSDNLSARWAANSAISFSGDDHAASTRSLADNFFPNSQQHSQQDNLATGSSQILSTSNSVAYTGANSLLRINSFIGVNNSNTNNSTSSMTLEKDTGYARQTATKGVDNSVTHTFNTAEDIYFEKRYTQSQNRLSAQLIYQSSTNRQQEENQANSVIQLDSLQTSSRQHYFIHTGNSSNELSSRLNYYFSLGMESFLDLGYRWNYSTNKNDRLTSMPSNISTELIRLDSLSNVYSLHSQSHLLHLGYLGHINKWQVNLGLDAMPGSLKGEINRKESMQAYRYFNMLPQAQLVYTISARQKLNFDVSSSTSLPTLQQLQPVIDLSNPQYPVEGNPHLKPSYSQNAALHYEFSSIKADRYLGIRVGLSYQTTKDMIITSITLPRDTSTVIQKTNFANANGFNTVKADYQVNLPSFLHRRLQFNIDGNISTGNTSSMLDNVLYTTTSFSWTQGLNMNLTVPLVIESTLGGYYTYTVSKYADGHSSPIRMPSFTWVFNSRHFFFKKWILNYTARQIFTSSSGGALQPTPILIDASLKREFFRNNQASVNLNVFNLLDQNPGVLQSATPTSINQKVSNMAGRYFMLSVIFKLNKFKQPS